MKHDYQIPFDMSLLSDNIIMAFTDPMDCLEPNQPVPEDNYRYFTTNFTGKGIHTYYLFQTKEAFIQAWIELYNKSKGMWYWVLDHGTCICSGALDLTTFLSLKTIGIPILISMKQKYTKSQQIRLKRQNL